MPIDIDELRRQFRAAKRNLKISQDYHTSKPSAVGTKIPVKGKHGRCNQQGITKVSVTRKTELDMGKPQVVVKRVLLATEAEKRAQVMACWELAAEWSRNGHGIYGAARYSWIAGRCGLSLREVTFLLGKTK